jgi:hypothetical protein
MPGARSLPLATAAALALPVLAGIGWMGAGGAPVSWLGMNGAALGLALALALLLPLPHDEARVTLLAAMLVAALFATAFAGTALGGVRRWASLGPVTLHVGYLVLPLLAALTPRLPSGRAVALLVLALLATLFQPDRATSIALAAALAALAYLRRDRATFVGLIVAIAGCSAALTNPDTLAPVRFVERVQQDAWAVQPLAGLALALTSLAPLLMLRESGLAALPLALFMVAAGAMAFAGPYPSILIGYGAAPILGFGLALAALRCHSGRR